MNVISPLASKDLSRASLRNHCFLWFSAGIVERRITEWQPSPRKGQSGFFPSTIDPSSRCSENFPIPFSMRATRARYAAAHLGVPAGQYVLIAVTDTGTGMAADVIEKAFDPFFTTKAVGQGTGLGLSQVYGFTKRSGGHVKIYSDPGHGTSIKIYLPRHRGAPEEADAHPVASNLTLGDEKELVLLVEDEPAVRQFAAI